MASNTRQLGRFGVGATLVLAGCGQAEGTGGVAGTNPGGAGAAGGDAPVGAPSTGSPVGAPSTGSPVGAPSTGSPACEGESEGWCWVRGRPLQLGSGGHLESVYAIGPSGAFHRWESGAWVAVPVPTTRWIVSAAIGAPDDIWVSDEIGSAWHYAGSEWTELPATEPISRVFRTRDGTVWAQAGAQADAHGGGSSGGHLLQWQGGAWVPGPAPFPYCLGGDYLPTQDGEIWSTGLVCDDSGRVSGAEVRWYDGSDWQLVGAPLGQAGWYPTFLVVDGRVRVRVSALWEWDGAAWQEIVVPEPPQGLPAGQRAIWDGGAYTILPSSSGCESVVRLDAEHAWCSGDGQVYFQDGGAWSATLADPFRETQGADRWGSLPAALWAGSDTRRAWGVSATDVYRTRAASGEVLEHFDGTRWTTLLDYRVHDLDGSSAADVWLATERGPVQFDGEAFVSRPLPAALASEGPAGEPVRVRALGAGKALLATRERLLRFDAEWSLVREAGLHRRIDSIAARGQEIWLVESPAGRSFEAFLFHFDGAAWSELTAPTLASYGHLVATESDVWALSRNFVGRVDASGLKIALTLNSTPELPWIADGAIWLTTHKQARRHALP